jgi:uncharacterized protein YbjT (DUF2867 family)
MRILARIAFFQGLTLGLAAAAIAGAAALIYLFTGKFALVRVSDEGPEPLLLTGDETVSLIRELAEKAKASQQDGGEQDD